jgi:hypothetical protein
MAGLASTQVIPQATPVRAFPAQIEESIIDDMPRAKSSHW